MPDIVLRTTPYRGIHPYRYADHDDFFGREQIIEELLVNVILYRLVVLFGDSGAGKSSVINAGLMPELKKKGFQPERLRVSPVYQDFPFLIERIQVGSAKNSDFLPSIFIDDSSKGADANERVPCSVDHFFSAIREKSNGTNHLLVFDQFEELFTLFRARQQNNETHEHLARNQILNTLFEIVNDQQLKVKILIIIREDFWGKLEILSKRYPKIFDHYVRLKHLDPSSAKKAIVGPFEDHNFFPSRLTEDLADTIIRELSEDDLQGQVHATQLQIVCDQLWQRYALKRSEITMQEFVAAGGVKGILEGYFTSELDKLGPSHRFQAIQMLGNLITESGTRDIVSEYKLKGSLGVQDEQRLNAILERLETLRIINRTQQRDNLYYEIASEYLIGPINKEKQQLLKDSELKRQRRKWRWVLAVVILTSAASYKIYSVWQESQPWGFVRNLATSTVHPLQGGFASIGRSTEGFSNTIDLKFKLVSRIHLLISRKQPDQSSTSWLATLDRDIVAIDMRSLNGTTINAQFLPYGSFGKLEDDDIIALAGVATFQFSQTRTPPLPQPSGWGLVIDGKSRIVHYLSQNRYVLSLNGQEQIVIGNVEAPNSFLTIAYANGQIAIKGKKSDHDLWTTMRLGDYTYVRCRIPPERAFGFLDVRELDSHAPCEVITGRRDINDITQPMHDLFSVTYTYGDTSFQIVPIASESDSVAAAR